MTNFTEARHPGEFIIAEANGNLSREVGLIIEAVAIKAGQVLGQIVVNEGAITVGAPAFTGTGDGVLTKATPAHGAGVLEGDYVIRLMEAGANAGNFQVKRPDGKIDGYAQVGAAYDGQVKFTIADGDTDFSGAAQFVLPVTIGENADVTKWAPHDPAAGTSVKTAKRIAIYPLAAADTDRKIAMIARDCTVIGPCLEWKAGISADDKTAGEKSLEEAGIVVR